MRLDRRVLACVFAVVAMTSAWASQDTLKKAYVVANIEVSNAQQYADYMKVTPGVIEQFGGRFVTRGGRTATLEGPPAPGRVVIIEFPSFERAQEFYNSTEYTAAKKLRAGAASVQFTLVEGF